MSILTSRTICCIVIGPASQHRDSEGDSRGVQHGQNIHRHGLCRARSQEPHGDDAWKETSIPAR